jgi:hypothetical protein
MAARSEAWIAFARSNVEIVVSNPIQGMDVFMRLFCVCVVLCVCSDFATTEPPSKESYRPIEKLKKRSRSNKGL